jgi:hypothetical protein
MRYDVSGLKSIEVNLKCGISNIECDVSSFKCHV